MNKINLESRLNESIYGKPVFSEKKIYRIKVPVISIDIYGNCNIKYEEQIFEELIFFGPVYKLI